VDGPVLVAPPPCPVGPLEVVVLWPVPVDGFVVVLFVEPPAPLPEVESPVRVAPVLVSLHA
jgi:hypothetical protein